MSADAEYNCPPVCRKCQRTHRGPCQLDQPGGLGWVRVAEKLPEMGLYVWVTAGGGTAHVAKRVNLKEHASWCWTFVTYDGWLPVPFVPTHWQSLVLPAPLST